MEKQQRSANAVGGRTARACDGCIRRRARWYCAADDAFLCQACDSSVHSANTLARRHHRLRLNTSSSPSPSLSLLKSTSDDSSAAPAWHHGFKRKARTPRPHHHHTIHTKPNAPPPAGKIEPLVPDLADGASGDDEEQLLYRVPIFDPVLADFCSPPRIDLDFHPPVEEAKSAAQPPAYTDGLAGFHPTDMELADFAADVDSLLGRGLDDVDAFCMEGLGILDSREEEEEEEEDGGRVKMEVEGEAAGVSGECCHDMEMETLDINFDYYGSPAATLEERKEEEVSDEGGEGRRLSLRLDYEAVAAEWSVKGCSAWTDGDRPVINIDDCWPDFMVMWGGGGEAAAMYGKAAAAAGDGGREARVTRYREKRRTRLFSKKIRYEVRKLNAEKRPRMKGRFVKRASFPTSSAAAGGFPY